VKRQRKKRRMEENKEKGKIEMHLFARIIAHQEFIASRIYCIYCKANTGSHWFKLIAPIIFSLRHQISREQDDYRYRIYRTQDQMHRFPKSSFQKYPLILGY